MVLEAKQTVTENKPKKGAGEKKKRKSRAYHGRQPDYDTGALEPFAYMSNHSCNYVITLFFGPTSAQVWFSFLNRQKR